MNENKKSCVYIRVGTQYYKEVNQPLASGDTTKKLIQWNIQTLREDEKKSFIAKINKYDGFCIVPSHIDYKQIMGTFYNKYEPIYHKLKKGDFDYTKKFIEHIFGSQYELGLDYLTLLFLKPLQILPILSLVSEARHTGKTTFLNWLKAIYMGNMTINSNNDFRSQFNSDWVSKLIISVDETFLEKKEDSERIKNLSTGKYFKSEAKGKDRYEIEFFGKFILCSNNETSFIKIDDNEIRYWVRKIPKYKEQIKNFDELLMKEIPHFLYFLTNRELTTKKATRMWFTPAQIKTTALMKLKKGNKSILEIELITILKNLMLDFDVNELKYTLTDIINLLKQNGTKIKNFQLQNLLNDKWKLTPSNSTSYTCYAKNFNDDDNIENKKGRCYTFNINIFQDKELTAYIKEYYKDYKESLVQINDKEILQNMTKEFNNTYKMNVSKDEFYKQSLQYKNTLISVAQLQTTLN